MADGAEGGLSRCTASIALGWRRPRTWQVGLLMALYALSVLHTAQVERRVTQALHLFSPNEMRYFEEMLRRTDNTRAQAGGYRR